MTAGTSALLVLIGGGAAAVAVMTKEEPRVASAADRGSMTAAPVDGLGGPAGGLGEPVPAPTGGIPALGAKLGGAGQNAGMAGVGERNSVKGDRTATRSPRQSASGADTRPPSAGGAAAAPSAAAATTPVVTTQTVNETRAIPYRTRLVRDPALPRGQKRIDTEGINGEETLRWLVTYADGRQTDRQLVDTVVTREPQHRVIAFGWQGRGHGHGSGHWQKDGHRRECGRSLGACLPLGRSACPDLTPEESGRSGGVVPLLDEDLALLDPAELDGLALDPALTCS